MIGSHNTQYHIGSQEEKLIKLSSPNLLIENGLNSFAKTLVLSPWIDLLFSSSSLMHLHLVLCFALFNMFLFICLFSILLYFVFPKKNLKNQKNTKIVCALCTLVLVYLGWPLKYSFLNFVSFVTQMNISMHNKQVSLMARVCDE